MAEACRIHSISACSWAAERNTISSKAIGTPRAPFPLPGYGSNARGHEGTPALPESRIDHRRSRLLVSVAPWRRDACRLAELRTEPQSSAFVWQRPHKASRPGYDGCIRAAAGPPTNQRPGRGSASPGCPRIGQNGPFLAPAREYFDPSIRRTTSRCRQKRSQTTSEMQRRNPTASEPAK